MVLIKLYEWCDVNIIHLPCTSRSRYPVGVVVSEDNFWHSSLPESSPATPEKWRRHLIETFCALLAICAGNSPVTGEFPAQRSVTRSFLNGWANNGEAGDLRRYSAHHDVTVMFKYKQTKTSVPCKSNDDFRYDQVNSSPPECRIYMCRWTRSELVQCYVIVNWALRNKLIVVLIILKTISTIRALHIS